jgi:non-specific serine/threonine protein kinase
MGGIEADQHSFAALLRHYRRAARLTQEALAVRAQLSLRGISDLERGERLRPRAETVDLLATALGLDPTQRAALQAAALRSHRERPAPAIASLPTSGPAPSQLPTPVSSFIGREQELAELQRLLRPPTGRRLVTLTGSGGCGKSRLALRVASDLAGAFADDARLVELASLNDARLLTRTVAAVFGLPETPGVSIEDTLIRFLGPRHLLLLLDNCEHLVDACAALASAILRACPHVVLVATSREPLRVDGEVAWRVPSLALPPDDVPLPETEPAGFDAVHLFVERARDVQRNFRLTPQNTATVVTICRQLDGIPLAIELASARLTTLSPQQIAARLTDRFAVLTVGNRNAPPQHQTLRKAIDWSYELLDEAERTLFRRLSVFTGGFVLDLAERVCADDVSDVRAERSLPRLSAVGGMDVVDLIQRLVEKSLVIAPADDGESYRMLDTLHQYAREKLVASGEAEEITRRHSAAYLALSETAEPELHQRDQVAWFERLDRERGNLRAALTWLTAHDRPVDALRLAAALGWFWIVRGYYAEGREWLTDALARVEAPDVAPLRARAWHALTWLASRHGDHLAAQRYCEACLSAATHVNEPAVIVEALALAGIVERDTVPEHAKRQLAEALRLAREADLRGLAGPILVDLGVVETYQGDVSGGMARIEEGLALLRELGDVAGLAFALNLACMIADLCGDYRQVRGVAEEYRPLVQVLGDRSGQANWRFYLAKAARWSGDFAEAEALLAQALAIYRDADDRYGIASAVTDLSRVHLEQRDVERAHLLAQEGLGIARAMNEHLRMRALRAAGDVAFARGEVEAAKAHYHEGLGLQPNHWAGVLRVSLIEGLAKVASLERRPARALRLVGAAAAERDRLGATPSYFDREWLDRALTSARQSLGDTLGDAAYVAGQAMALPEAAAYALSDDPD